MLLTAAIALLIAAPAAAKAPPRGAYDCVIGSGGTLFGTLTIKSKSRYAHRGSHGTFRAKGGLRTYPDGIAAYPISFKKGTLGGMKGRWHKTSDGVYEIALRNPTDDFESIYCDRR
ncbi:MAG: hypothetical protein HY827_04405 [Actinobacteria bacterium]|nr:hypothetical protein [Actinomycetota bacterium]